MDKSENQKKLQGQIQSLHSGNKSAILNTLKELRSLGKVAILPDLFQVMLVQEDEQILGELSSFLNDLKDPEAAEVLARAVANPEYKSIQTTLTAACWQNGLNERFLLLDPDFLFLRPKIVRFIRITGITRAWVTGGITAEKS